MEKQEKQSEPKKELEKCQKEKEEYLAGWQRARADFLNYKKDETGRIKEVLEYEKAGTILKILSILDNLERAEREAPKELKNNEFLKGFLQIKIQLQGFLKNHGVEEIKTIGEEFDPNFQEVIQELEVKGKKSGIVVEETQKGYTLNGRVVRPARVKISK